MDTQKPVQKRPRYEAKKIEWVDQDGDLVEYEIGHIFGEEKDVLEKIMIGGGAGYPIFELHLSSGKVHQFHGFKYIQTIVPVVEAEVKPAKASKKIPEENA